MNISYDKLVDILDRSVKQKSEVLPANDTLYIRFVSDGDRTVKDTITFYTVDQRELNIDIDHNGNVLGLEIL